MNSNLLICSSTNTEKNVRKTMEEIADIFNKHGCVTVHDICKLIGLNTYTEYNYIGWDNVDDIYSYRLHDMTDGLWRINFPDPKRLCEEPNKMSQERFQKLLDELDGNSLQTLKEKNARYSQNGDALHNFRSGAEIAGGTPAQACWGYLTKHLVALRDKVERNDFSNREDFLEKCQDTINYIRFLWCIGNENEENRSNKEEKESK